MDIGPASLVKNCRERQNYIIIERGRAKKCTEGVECSVLVDLCDLRMETGAMKGVINCFVCGKLETGDLALRVWRVLWGGRLVRRGGVSHQ